eukprot:GHVL01022183.1.p2 GENE.GHVL01022183.1~~GHVL01022183.1.p2  ORF type:complete len:124 (-),score=3.20 GHVL01022183.1:254-625(-)
MQKIVWNLHALFNEDIERNHSLQYCSSLWRFKLRRSRVCRSCLCEIVMYSFHDPIACLLQTNFRQHLLVANGISLEKKPSPSQPVPLPSNSLPVSKYCFGACTPSCQNSYNTDSILCCCLKTP